MAKRVSRLPEDGNIDEGNFTFTCDLEMGHACVHARRGRDLRTHLPAARMGEIFRAMGRAAWDGRSVALRRGVRPYVDVDAPSIPFTIVAGFAFGMGKGVLSIMFGIMIGAALGFLFARYGARGAIAQKIAANPRFNTIDRAIAKDGWKIVGLLRMCPVPFGITNYLYGLTAIEFWRYMGATLVGMLPGCVAFVYVGAFGKDTLDGPRPADPVRARRTYSRGADRRYVDARPNRAAGGRDGAQ